MVELVRVENPYWWALRAHPKETLMAALGWGEQFAQFPWRLDRDGRPAGLDFGPNGEWPEGFVVRDFATSMWSWSIPSPNLLWQLSDFLRGRGLKVVDVGAGTGYWAFMLDQYGVDVVAYDLRPPATEPNNWHHPVQWYQVHKAPASAAAAMHPDRVLFLSWPPHARPMAEDALRSYAGDWLIYIGEGQGGATGDEGFFELLQEEWVEVASLYVPQWAGIRDWLYIFERKS